ncbi:hypothetical protein SAMN05421738_10396 [Algoriella xinjiangensis]|uniref:Uncharacterized protein n=1 Tax=Algoriella xinjiangensis TaxID=684065 RepID=A0A1I4U6P5_9FLAO|nr:hypothetical protein [Algoriella xinjiangensis]SFM84520.1 hypothetical protein SAMN05421738_10396 [Algoriella xinjiangensis]VDH17868.1 Uncharacterised protein [Algoriella xinjiangensis]
MKNLEKFQIKKENQKNIKGGSAPICDYENGFVTCLLPKVEGSGSNFKCLLEIDCIRQGGSPA